MTKIIPNLLNDTFNLVALARETALRQGDQARAEQLNPLVNDLRGLVREAYQPGTFRQPQEQLASSDFRTLLSFVQTGTNSPTLASSPAERQKVIAALAAGGAPETEIARQLGVTREEVRLILSISAQSTTSHATVSGQSPKDGVQAGGVQSPAVETPAHRLVKAYTQWNDSNEEVSK